MRTVPLKLLYNKYRSLYSSVPTDDNELREIHDVIDSRLSTSTYITATPDIIKQCIYKPKPGKDDGDLGFKSDHIINGSHRLHVLLYNLMLLHGYAPTDLLTSSIIYIPKAVQVSSSNIGNYRGISLFNCICKLYDNVTLFLYGNYLSTSDMELGSKKGHSTTMCTLIYKKRLQTTQPTSGVAVTVVSSCCANCVEPPRPHQWGPDLPFFWHAGHADTLDGWRCCSQKRVMSRPIQVRQL